ncbi:low molecular weight protein tyrosine phosphatase family protein [Phenylobacterium aquaticum]|uniref:low molecular weight protein tyrosine phosphatase family protein n=1 Tax=Phenylobacterium aquaticum TaxID=1763816 RepID=UPI001F5C38C6|nr:low molecular weight protein tyrosine phosphatase family protein [Phenylobacterium aquaticum]
MKHVLFVCSQNKLRSPTAEQVFADWPGIEVASAGLNHDAVEPLTGEMVAEADLIFVMEKAQRNRLSQRFKAHLKRARVICLDIPDDYAFMDPDLIALLRAKVPRHLPSR